MLSYSSLDTFAPEVLLAQCPHYRFGEASIRCISPPKAWESVLCFGDEPRGDFFLHSVLLVSQYFMILWMENLPPSLNGSGYFRTLNVWLLRSIFVSQERRS